MFFMVYIPSDVPPNMFYNMVEAIPQKSDSMQLFVRPELFTTAAADQSSLSGQEATTGAENIFVMTLVENTGRVKRSGRKPRTLVKKIKAALNWPTANGDKLVKGRHIEEMLTGNATFPVPYPSNIVTLVNLGLHLDDFENALGQSDSDLIASTEVIVHDDLKNIMTMVQIKMDQTRPQAETICTGAGYDVGKETPHSPRINDIKTGTEPGSAILYGVGPGMHEWELSYDGGQTSKPLRPTTKGRKELTGETPDIPIWQRNCLVLPNDTYGEWTEWVSGKTGK